MFLITKLILHLNMIYCEMFKSCKTSNEYISIVGFYKKYK